MDATSFGVAVKNIIKSTGSGAWYGPLTGLVGSNSPFPTREEQLALLSEFSAAWDEEAMCVHDF